MLAAASEQGGQQRGLELVDTLCALGEEERSLTSSEAESWEGEGEAEGQEEGGGGRGAAAAAAAGAEAAPGQVGGMRCPSLACLHGSMFACLHAGVASLLRAHSCDVRFTHIWLPLLLLRLLRLLSGCAGCGQGSRQVWEPGARPHPARSG